MKSPGVKQVEEYLKGVAAQIEGWIGDTKQVAGEYVTDVVIVVKTESQTIKATRNFPPRPSRKE